MIDATESRFGLPDDPEADCAPALMRAAAATQERGGGDLVVPDRRQGYRLCRPVELAGLRNVEIRWPMTPIVHDTVSWPTVRLTDCHRVVLDRLAVVVNRADAAPVGYDGEPEYAPIVGVEDCGDVEIARFWAGSCIQGIACGTPLRPRGARSLVVGADEIGYSHSGVRLYGADYGRIIGRHWQDNSQAGTAVWIGGPGYAHGLDGITIDLGLVEHCNVGARISPSGRHNVANVRVSGVFDRVRTAGVWLSPGLHAAVNHVDVTGARLNCLPGAFPVLVGGRGVVDDVRVVGDVVVHGATRDAVTVGKELRRATDVWHGGERLASGP